jgi:hypothetical protein
MKESRDESNHLSVGGVTPDKVWKQNRKAKARRYQNEAEHVPSQGPRGVPSEKKSEGWTKL